MYTDKSNVCAILQLPPPLELYSTADYNEIIQAENDYSATMMRVGIMHTWGIFQS